MGPSVCKFSCIDGLNALLVAANIHCKNCDDGNHVNNDGCTTLCNVDTGWTCSGGTAAGPDTCKEICGDGYDYGTYACDDGNLLDGDGCSSKCTVEPGFTCKYGTMDFPDTCIETSCPTTPYDLGNFPCVDANNNNGDG